MTENTTTEYKGPDLFPFDANRYFLQFWTVTDMVHMTAVKTDEKRNRQKIGHVPFSKFAPQIYSSFLDGQADQHAR